MGRVPYSEFAGSRARFQRLSDQKIFSGWLRELRSDRISVTADEPADIVAGERFLVQVQGPSADAYMIASSTGGAKTELEGAIYGATAKQLVHLPANCYDFEVATEIQLRDAQQTFRKCLSAIAASVCYYGEEHDVLVTDGSPAGMGVLVWRELRQGAEAEVKLFGPDFRESFTAEIRHCRPETRILGAYRAGLRFITPDRIALVAWRKLLKGE